jgi:hypothetical protein
MFYAEDFLGLRNAKPAGCGNIMQDHTVSFFREIKTNYRN